MTLQLRDSSQFSCVPFSTHSYKYDVFLSFRGKDTRENFTGHLYRYLSLAGIKTFIDDNLTRGEEISQALVRVIEDSKLFLIVFSENYASSKWCLDELVHILKCKRLKNQAVHPIFYKVNPSDVRHQRGKFGEAFAELESRFKDGRNKVLCWRAALSEAATLSGWPFLGGYEYKFIERIVKEVYAQVKEPTYVVMPERQIGIDSRIEHMIDILDVGRSNVCMVAICGTGGIGKTTIAKAVYNEIADMFDGCCFLADVRKSSEQHGGLVNLQNSFLSTIDMQKSSKINNLVEGVTLLRRSLRRKRILLVADDVDTLDQLKNIVGRTYWYGHGSRVIITTRNEHLLIAHQKCLIYKAQKLDDDEARELLCAKALVDIENLDDIENLIVTTVVEYARGIPLALEVLGSNLCDTSVHNWPAMLNGFKKDPPKCIQDILMFSYDGLQDTVKEAFLDIACFFQGWKKNDVIQKLKGCGRINVEDSVKVLEKKDLIYVDRDGRICMHNKLEEMGKDVVHQESTEPGERSRLWHHKDVQDILTKNTGTSKIEGIMVKMPTLDEIHLSPQCFKNMKNLKIFINVNGRFVGKVDYYRNQLRVLDWPGFPLQSLPSDFDMEALVHLNIRGSRIVHLGKGFKSMQNLTSLNLRECKFLTQTPDLFRSPNLELLDLSYCNNLVEIHPSVGSLEKLFRLDLRGCIRLTQIPDLSGSPNLQILDLGRCKSLVEVHPSVGSLEKLVWLDLRDCSNLVRLPGKVNWISLKKLNLDYCSSLERLPEIGGEMRYMTSLSLCWTAIRALPSFIWDLSTLSEIDLSGCPLVVLPECIKEFVNLTRLRLRGCSRLVEIPELPPGIKSLDVGYCESLERISKLSNMLERKESQMIEWMDFTECWVLCQNLVEMINVEDDKVDGDLFYRLLSPQRSKFTIIFPVPRGKVPKWFKGHRQFEFSIEALPNFKWFNTGLALRVVADDQNWENLSVCNFEFYIYINEMLVSHEYGNLTPENVWLCYVPFHEMQQFCYVSPLPPFTCRVLISQLGASQASCGVQLVNCNAIQ